MPRLPGRNVIVSVVSAILSQSFASIATLVLSVLVARTVSAPEFGIFAIVLSAWIILVGSIRAATAEVYIFNHAHLNSYDRQRARSAALLSGFILAIILGLALVLVCAAVQGTIAPYLMVLGFGLPALLLQDSNRMLLNVSPQPARALVPDVLYICLLVVSMLVPQQPTLLYMTWAWISCSFTSAIVGTFLVGPSVNRHCLTIWMHTGRKRSLYFFSDFFVSNGIANAAVFLVAAFGSLSDSAAIRGCQVLLIPVLLIMRGASVTAGPRLAKLTVDGNSAKVPNIVGALSITLLCTVVAAGVAVALTPPSTMKFLLGDSAKATLALFPYAAIATLALGIATVGMIGLKAIGQVQSSVRLKLLTAPATLSFLVLGTIYSGAPGSQIALASGEGFRSVLQWRTLKRRSV
jgi:O-antigen/teichoic acid export membrane protein